MLMLWYGEFAGKYFDGILMQNSPVVLNLAIVTGLEGFYNRAAKWLTLREGHVTYRAFRESLITKTVGFQLLNCLGWFLYLAFWLQDLARLKSQLIQFLTIKQGIAAGKELLLPKVMHFAFGAQVEIKRFVAETTKDLGGATSAFDAMSTGIAAAEQTAEEMKSHFQHRDSNVNLETICERELYAPQIELVDEYTQMAVLFASTTFFMVLFPGGFVLALFTMVVTRYSDGFKLLKVSQRMVPKPPDQVLNDVWYTIFKGLLSVSIACNVGLVAIADGTSWSTFDLVVAEHILFVFTAYIFWCIPEVPEEVARAEVKFAEKRRLSHIKKTNQEAEEQF